MSRGKNKVKEENVELELTIISETGAAWLVTDGDFEEWLPKSQVSIVDYRSENEVLMAVPEWLATTKGLV